MKHVYPILSFLRINTIEKASFKTGAATFTAGEALHLVSEKLSIALKITGLISFGFYIILLDLTEVELKFNDKVDRIKRLGSRAGAGIKKIASRLIYKAPR